MEYVIAIAVLGVLCGLWVLVQLVAGRSPRACRGDGRCEERGLRSCTRGGGRCDLADEEPPDVDVVPEDRLASRDRR